MISFARNEQIGIAAEVGSSFVLANGAFSLWRVGQRRPAWDSYYRWVEAWRNHPGFDFAIIPDVIDGSEEENDDLMAQWPQSRSPNVSTGATVAGLALGENRRWVAGSSKGGRAAWRPVDRSLFEAYDGCDRRRHSGLLRSFAERDALRVRLLHQRNGVKASAVGVASN
jgi:hypothetical protein